MMIIIVIIILARDNVKNIRTRQFCVRQVECGVLESGFSSTTNRNCQIEFAVPLYYIPRYGIVQVTRGATCSTSFRFAQDGLGWALIGSAIFWLVSTRS